MYSEMLNKIDPLKSELHNLEVEAEQNRKKAQEMQELVTELEKSIARCVCFRVADVAGVALVADVAGVAGVAGVAVMIVGWTEKQ